MKYKTVPGSETAVLLAGLFALFIVPLVYQRPPFYDEVEYLKDVAVLQQYGFSNEYLRHLTGSAGPLYSMVHFILEPLTRLKGVYVRWVNLGFLIGVLYVVTRLIALFDAPARYFSLYIMAVPMVYVIAGLALTEMPAMFFFSLALYLVVKSTSQDKKNILIEMLLAGLCMSLAILGRQPYLLTIAAFPLLFLPYRNVTSTIVPLAVLLLFSVLLPAYVFKVWNGLVPTIESQLYKDIAKAGVSYRFDFFLLCSFYLSAATLLVAPAFFPLPVNKKYWLAALLLFVLLSAANFNYGWLDLFPLKWVANKLFHSPFAVHLFSSACGTLVIFLSFYFWGIVFYRMRRHSNGRIYAFFALALFLLAFSCVKITWGFSSRYAAQAVPLLIPFAVFFYRPCKYNLPRILLGAGIGLISLISYFHND